MSDWNPDLYQSGYSYVWQRGRDVVGLLSPQPGERILDLGCGTGQLTAEIANAGAVVTGSDKSPAMIEQARANYPQIRFETAEAEDLPFREEFDAVFSNAALHWMPEADAVAASVARALKPGGRFVVEFGGKGNVAGVIEIGMAALRAIGVKQPERLNPWYCPSIAEHATTLERNGFEVTFGHLFDRPTPLDGGEHAVSQWFRMFGRSFTEALDAAQLAGFERRVDEAAAVSMPEDGVWKADYRRLRMVAVKTTYR